MRLWSLHPKYLDAKGLVACWREGLLARKVLLGLTRGYRNHPQLERFRSSAEPLASIDYYLSAICDEAGVRGYRFDLTKIGKLGVRPLLPVTMGQLFYEFAHLRDKLETRDQSRFNALSDIDIPLAHPLFSVVDGDVESWERPGLITSNT